MCGPGVSRTHAAGDVPPSLLRVESALVLDAASRHEHPARAKAGTSHQEVGNPESAPAVRSPAGRDGHDHRSWMLGDDICGALTDGRAQRASQQSLALFLEPPDDARGNSIELQSRDDRNSSRSRRAHGASTQCAPASTAQQRAGRIAPRTAAGQHEGCDLVRQWSPSDHATIIAVRASARGRAPAFCAQRDPVQNERGCWRRTGGYCPACVPRASTPDSPICHVVPR